MRRTILGGLLTATMILGVSSGASAIDVQRSGNTYHIGACARTTGMMMHCDARIVSDANGNVLGSAQPPISGKTPADLTSAYKITTTGSSSTIIAIVDAFGYTNAESDLGVYRSQWGLPACTTGNGCFKKLNQRGKQKNYPPQNIGWAQESALDLDMASAMCPACQIWLVEADTNSLASLSKAVNTAAAMGAHVISNSYSGGDNQGALLYGDAYNHPGVAITASTGDSGFGTGFPATSTFVTAVGGTHLVADGSQRGWSETAWHGAGSGCSKHWAKPEWQTDAGCKMRMAADVSAVADPATGVAVYGPNGSGNSQWLVFGGTSVSAPLIGGIYGNNGGAVNYGSNPYAHTANLFDVVSGNNGTCKAGKNGKKTYFCTSGPGYDGPTGLGTPNGLAAFGD